MSKKTALITILAVLALIAAALAAFYFFYYLPNYATPPAEAPTGPSFNSGPERPVIPATSTPSTTTNTPTSFGDSFPKIRQVTNSVVAGATVNDVLQTVMVNGKKQSFFSTLIRYMNRGDGHIFETPATSTLVTEISATTIPKVYEALFTNNGAGVVARYLDSNGSVVSYAASLVARSASATNTSPFYTDGTYLPLNVSSVGISPQSTKISYVSSGSVYTANADGSRKTAVYSGPFTNWITSYPEASTVMLVTKPSAQVEGFAYTVSGSSLIKLIGPVQGLTASLSPSKTYLLYSRTSGNSISTYIRNLKTGADVLTEATLPEKCVWSTKEKDVVYCAIPSSISGSNLPDAWYQGTVSFSDTIKRIDAATGKASLVLDPTKESSGAIDAIDLHVNSQNTTLIFTNKKNYSLWAVRLDI